MLPERLIARLGEGEPKMWIRRTDPIPHPVPGWSSQVVEVRMRTMITGALLMAGALTLAPRAGVAADATGDATEIRVFVLDKTGAPVDLKNWTGAVDVMPARGQR